MPSYINGISILVPIGTIFANPVTCICCVVVLYMQMLIYKIVDVAIQWLNSYHLCLQR